MNHDPSTRLDQPAIADEIAEATTPPPLAQALRAGRYRLMHVLGEGTMSIVYAAWDTRLERPVAIKELRVDFAAHAESFEREARVLAAIHHKNVVTIHALHTDDGAPFLVMEWVDGKTLETTLRDGPPSPGVACGILRQVARGLDAVHAAGLVHGDVKPANVLIDRTGEIKVADVGLVPFLERMEPGQILGTPSYMPPERALGRVLEPSLVPRSDVYSFAVMCFELLAGSPPFATIAGDNLLQAHASAPAPRVSEASGLARAFDEPLMRAMSKDPARRQASCGELVDALERARSSTDPRGRALRVLVVDDDSDVRATLSELLASRLRGAVIEAAPDGATALGSIAHTAPHVVIMDLAMPGLCGIELVAEIRRVAPSVGVLIMTGSGSGAEWRLAHALGAYRFLVKPVQIGEVVRAIRELVDPTLRAAWQA